MFSQHAAGFGVHGFRQTQQLLLEIIQRPLNIIQFAIFTQRVLLSNNGRFSAPAV